MSKNISLVILSAALFGTFSLTAYGQETQFVVLSESSGIGIIQGAEQYFRIDNGIWGPNWSWTSYEGNVVVEAGKSISRLETTLRQTGAKLNLDVTTEQTAPQQLSIDYRLKSSKDTQLTLAIVSLSFSNLFADSAKVIAKSSDNTTQTRSFPLGLGSFDEPVSQLELMDKDGLKTNIQISPAAKISIDNSLRIILAEEQIKAASTKEVKLIVSFPQILTYYGSPGKIPNDKGFDSWFPWEPKQDYDMPSEIGMSDWLQAPTGRHGRILRKNDDLIYNGKPIKLWGLNLCYSSCAPEKSLSEKRAKFYSKYGINSVRLHKYADGPGWQGIQAPDSFLEFEPAALDRMDYQVAQFKKHGIYTKLSSTFGVKLGPNDSRLVPYMDEFGKLTGNQKRLSTGHGSVFLSREIQDMQIKQIVKLLEHKNSYTGLTYAEDPAVVVVELFNEDSVLFFGTLRILQTIPTLRRHSAQRFCEWLMARYGGENALIAAWGKDALNSFSNEGITGESLSKKTIVPAGNPWFYDPQQLAGSQKHKRVRMYDTMQFLYEMQNDFYSRYVAAIRATGYKGEILGSNWQAGRDVSHYYNLRSDYLVGLIDRHNYFGGSNGGSINNTSMCRIPGSALLSTGMQQVTDRPFMLSEWIHVFPNEWGVEGPAIIGAYAMGLQGWDVSYMFQNRDSAGFSSTIGRDQWDVTAPQVLGVFPAVARQVLRGDVRESDIQAIRYVHVPSLRQGKLGFEDKVIHEHDIKTFDSDKVPSRALSVARCVVEFTDQYRQTPVFDISPYFKNGIYQSSTGQLSWKEGDSRHSGYFTINTAATRAVVGFAQGQTIRLGNITIRPKSQFAAIYITAKEKDKDLSSSAKLLVVALARARNTGMKIFRNTRLLSKGSSPVLMEPVHAEITVNRSGSPKVIALDHDGRKTDVTVPISNSTFEINGARYKTIYYEIEY
jgi:hypothetical protein